MKHLEFLDKQKIKEKLDARSFLNEVKNLKDLPSPETLKDIDKACKIVQDAIKKGKKITIVGDYDVDGIVASVILKDFFDFIGKKTDVLIPNRFSDGYGLSDSIVDRVDADLIITVDNGISSVEAVKKAKDKGMSVIITDHHICPAILPEADAIVNPKQADCPFKEKDIAGATVAWYFIAHLKNKMGVDLDMYQFLDIMAFAIIADSMPLISINRTLAKAGISYAQKSKRQAILVLKNRLNISMISSNDISFGINPRLNSAGRMKSANLAFEFLYTKDKKTAFRCFKDLDMLNVERKNIEKTILQKAKQMIDPKDSILLVWCENWHEGVIGIVAAKLTELYCKPAIVFSIKGEIAKGSARSKENVNLLEIIKSAEDKIETFGGHKNAAGLQVKKQNLQALKNTFDTKIIKIKDYDVLEDVLGILPLSYVDLELASLIESYQPFGQAFLEPVFLAKDEIPVQIVKIGKDENHIKLIFEKSGDRFDALWFNYTCEISLNKSLSFIYKIGKNTFRGITKPQILIQTIIGC